MIQFGFALNNLAISVLPFYATRDSNNIHMYLRYLQGDKIFSYFSPSLSLRFIVSIQDSTIFDSFNASVFPVETFEKQNFNNDVMIKMGRNINLATNSIE